MKRKRKGQPELAREIDGKGGDDPGVVSGPLVDVVSKCSKGSQCILLVDGVTMTRHRDEHGVVTLGKTTENDRTIAITYRVGY